MIHKWTLVLKYSEGLIYQCVIQKLPLPSQDTYHHHSFILYLISSFFHSFNDSDVTKTMCCRKATKETGDMSHYFYFVTTVFDFHSITLFHITAPLFYITVEPQ